MLFKRENRDEFERIIADLLDDPDVQKMKDLPQHTKTCNCFDHSVYVAYLSFLFCRRFGLNHVSAARAGLLHDFSLCNWDEEDAGLERLWNHPKLALKNAEERYELTPMEKDIIVKHMWPLTPELPRHKEAFVVSMADKIAATLEFCRLYRVFGVKRKLTTVMDTAGI